MVLEFLLKIHPTILIIVIGILVSVIMVVVYKYMTDQDLMKRLKEEIKELQKEMKELRNNPTKMAEVNKRAMETNMKYMMHSMKPTLITFIPIILVFGWLNSHIAFEPLIAGEEFSIDMVFYEGIAGQVALTIPEGLTLINGQNETQYIIKDNMVRFVLKGKEPGKYQLQYTLQDDAGNILKSWENKITITESKKDRAYEKPNIQIKDKTLKTITVSNTRFTPFGDVSIFGWHPGWISLYIIISLVCSLGLRKWLKIY